MLGIALAAPTTSELMKGFVPTPSETVDAMVQKLFHGLPPTPEDTVIDPGSGEGAFVDGILRYCEARDITAPRIIAAELDPRHVHVLRRRFAKRANVTVVEADFLRAELPAAKYIVGNPPYVSIAGLSEEERRRYRSGYKTAVGRFDLYMLFFERALRLLDPDGRLVFITPEKYLYVNSASPLRQLLAAQELIELSFVSEDTFDGRVTYPLITTLNRSAPNRPIRVVERNGYQHSVDVRLPSTSWLPIIRKVGSGSTAPRLADIAIRISCGVATGADSVFIGRNESLPEEIRPWAHPTLAGREVTSSTLPSTRFSMVTPYRQDGSLIPEAELGPLQRYLGSPERRERLLRRTCVKTKPWYAFHENPPLSTVLRPKLLCKDIGAHPVFVVDRVGDILPRHSLYYIVTYDTSILDELAEFLNSAPVARWLAGHCQRAANGYLRVQSHVLKEIPLDPALDPPAQQLDLMPMMPDRRTA